MSYLINCLVPKVPSEYEEVEYLFSPSGSYSRLGIKYSSEMTIEIKERHGSASSSVIGANPHLALTNTGTTRRVRYNSTVYDGGSVSQVITTKLDKNLLYYDGVLLRTFTKATFESTYPMLLGGRMSQVGFPEETAACTIYYCKISQDGVPIMDLVPVRNKITLEYGMYDFVSKQFFGNDGTGTFTGGKVVSGKTKNNVYRIMRDVRVPFEYEEVEYLQSDGVSNCYIDLDIHFNPLDEVETKFTNEDINPSDKYMVIAHPWNAPNNTRFGMGHHFRKFTCGWGNVTTSLSVLTPGTVEDNLPHTWTYKNRTYTITDINLSYTGSWSGWDGGSDNPSSTWGFVRLMWGYNSKTKGKMYYYHHITKDGVERYLVPVKKKSNNEYGMYDLVTKQFFGNSGTGAFTGGHPVHTSKKIYTISKNEIVVSSEYAKIEYLKSTGQATDSSTVTNASYIDTRFVPTHDTKMEIRMSIDTFISGEVLMGKTASGRFALGHSTSISTPNFYFALRNINKNSEIPKDTNVHTFVLDGKNDTCSVDDTTVKMGSDDTSIGQLSIFLFARHNANTLTANKPMNATVYYCKIWDDDILVRDFVPVKRLSDNALGLYDLVNKQFYGNIGSKEFTGGPEIENEPTPYFINKKTFLIRGGN